MLILLLGSVTLTHQHKTIETLITTFITETYILSYSSFFEGNGVTALQRLPSTDRITIYALLQVQATPIGYGTIHTYTRPAFLQYKLFFMVDLPPTIYLPQAIPYRDALWSCEFGHSISPAQKPSSLPIE